MSRLFLHEIPFDPDGLDLSTLFETAGKSKVIVTPNPEMCVKAWKEPWFLRVLQAADVSLVDGTGVALALSLQERQRVERSTGVDALLKIAQAAAQAGKRLTLLGGSDEARKGAVMELTTHFPSLQITHANIGLVALDADHKPVFSKGAESVLASLQTDVVALALSFGVQEATAIELKDRLPHTSVIIGVGGAYEMLSGRLPRAPRLLRAIGLEWLWRLVLQPHRLGRIWTAVGVFPWMWVRKRISNCLS